MAFLPDFSIEETKTFLTECDAQWEKEEPEFLEFAVLRDGIHIGAVGIYWNEIRDTLELGWKLLSILPVGELDRLSSAEIQAHYKEGAYTQLTGGTL